MNNKKEIRIIERHFASHSVLLKLIKCEIIGDEKLRIYTVKFKPGTKESLFFDRASDIRAALQLPLFQPFREGLSLCIAVSEQVVMENSLSKMLVSPLFHESRMWIPIPLGYDMRRKMHFVDLAKFPHALYAGASHSGKSVGLRSMITGIVVKQPVHKVNLLIIDTGASDLDLFNPLPHLSCPIVKDAETAVEVISTLIYEMERRIALPDSELKLLPAIICIVDEYISLITNIREANERKELTTAISSLLRRGRHAKIHMVLATQEAAKQDMQINLNNINARMAFMCSNFYNSVSILGERGADKLPGNGTMLFKSQEFPRPIYLQGAFISTEDIEKLISRLTLATHDLSNKFVISEVGSLQPSLSEHGILDIKQPKLDSSGKELTDIILWALSHKTISANQIQQQFRIGRRAADILDKLFQMGIVSEKFANQPRLLLPKSVEEISVEAMTLLLENGAPSEYIAVAIQNRC